jgi:regulator of protease activity HflC (stomatin/prohibitin superfamily)
MPEPFPRQGAAFNNSMIVVFFVLAAIYGVVTTSMYTVRSGSVGVLSTFGKFSDDIVEPGLHFKIPGIQGVRIMDIKMQTAHYQGGADKPDDDGVISKPRIVVLDSKNLNIGVELTVQFAPEPNQAKAILQTYGTNYFEKLINPNVRDIVRDVAGQYGAEEVAFKRSAIGAELHKRLTAKFDTLPFTLIDVQLRHIELPDIVKKKIEEVQIAKQEEQRLEMIEKQARKSQEIKTIEANTKLIEVTTEAKADAEKKRIEAEAKAYQITREADAVAEANKVITGSLNQQILQLEIVNKWNGQYPRLLAGGNSQGMILQLPNLSQDAEEQQAGSGLR